jgi:hypothetical protein
LLSLYRRLIHLRRTNDALATGELVPRSTRCRGVLRRAGDRAVRSWLTRRRERHDHRADSSLRGGQYARSLVGGPDGAALEVAADGAIANYQPVAGTLGRGEVLVLDLIAR